jgi:crotonobetainyl-CoA:carnitine CoA-transferase CaiB-like acyl-CoA transferase
VPAKESALSPFCVLDMGRVLAAPMTAQLLADFGAEVIKIERPGLGDEFRKSMPLMKDESGRPTSETAFFLSVNRSKQSVTVNLKHPEGRKLVKEFAAKVDVLVENYKVGDLARAGLDYASLSQINPRLIYCSITGFGQTGPYRNRAAYDPIIQAMGGMMAVTGNPEGLPGGGPVKVGPSIIDIVTAMTACNAILAALVQRERSGRGQHIDLALMDAGIAALSHHALMHLVANEAPERLGTDSNGNSPSGMFRCADGAIMLVTGSEEQFRRLCEALGCPQLVTDPRFKVRSLRIDHRHALREELEKYTRRLSVKEALATLEKATVAAGPFNELEAVFADPQVVHRGMAVNVPHPRNPALRLVASPARMSDSPVSYRPPPLLGEHTDAVLKSFLGKTDEQICQLREAGAI